MSDHAQTMRLPLVFLHGMFGTPLNWDVCARRLAPQRRVESPALPLLDLPVAETTVEGLGDWVLGWLHENGLARVVLCGNSLGGHAALRVALADPERVAGLVLTGSSGLFERGFGRTPRRPTREWIADRARGVFFDESSVPNGIVDEVFGMFRDPEKARRFVRIAKSAKRHSMRDELRRIKCPALLVWGSDDRVTPPSVAREFQGLLPESELAFIERCGHAPMMERPEEFCRHVERFLDRIDLRHQDPDGGRPN